MILDPKEVCIILVSQSCENRDSVPGVYEMEPTIECLSCPQIHMLKPNPQADGMSPPEWD